MIEYLHQPPTPAPVKRVLTFVETPADSTGLQVAYAAEDSDLREVLSQLRAAEPEKWSKIVGVGATELEIVDCHKPSAFARGADIRAEKAEPGLAELKRHQALGHPADTLAGWEMFKERAEKAEVQVADLTRRLEEAEEHERSTHEKMEGLLGKSDSFYALTYALKERAASLKATLDETNLAFGELAEETGFTCEDPIAIRGAQRDS